MKKFVAMVGLMLIMMVGAGVAQKSKGSAETVVRKAGTQVTPAVTNPSLTPVDDAGWVAGYLPVFDASGNLEDSYLNQVINSATVPPTVYLGFNTPTPSFNLHFTTTVDPAAVTVDGYGANVGINFIGRRARGTPALPSAVQAGDNLFTMNGRGWFTSGTSGVPSGFPASSRANVKLFAAEPWTDLAEGTYITFATTQIGTLLTNEKLRITDAGNVGIGTTTPGGAPPSPLPAPVTLEVNGGVKLTTGSGGGITFANGTTQTVPAYNITPANPTVTIANAGTAAQTIAVNTAVIQPIVNGTTTCPAGSAVTSISPATGAVQCGAIGPGGSLASTPTIVATVPLTSATNPVGTPPPIYTAPANGYYRVSVYMYVTLAGSCASPGTCAGEAIFVGWNDGISSTTVATSHCDLTAVCGSPGNVPLLYLQSGKSITVQGQIYPSGTSGLNAPTGSPTWASYGVVEQM
jgi:hypothetical protein